MLSTGTWNMTWNSPRGLSKIWLLQQCWIKELWRFLDEINGFINLKDEWEQSRCANDKFLMRIIHDMALSKDQIKKLNLCKLKKQVTFRSEIFHHGNNTFHPDVWTPDVPLQSNTVERFPKIENPRQYWDLWRTVLQAIKCPRPYQFDKQVLCNTKIVQKWLITTDCRYVYCKQKMHYMVHSFSHRQKHKLLYSKEPLFATTIESYDHLRYITPTLNDEFIAVLETNTLFKKPQEFIPRIKYIAELSINKLLNTASTTISKPLNKPPVPISPPYTESIYDYKTYQLYRDWWKRC